MPGSTTPLTSFIGREHEVAQVVDLLTSARLVTITGPGGVGKTRLALAVADIVRERLIDGAWFVSLAALYDPTLVASTIAQALGLGDYGEQPVEQTLTAYLGTRQLLLVIDNFEHILVAAPLVAELLSASPGLTVLATSRAPLQLSAEHVYPAPPLMLPDLQHLPRFEQLGQVAAIQLFVDRARASTPGFALTSANAAIVAAICSQVAGLPLALVLAAARLTVLSLTELQRQLDQPLVLLTGGARDQPERQQTMRATIAWSVDLLDEPEQQLFRQFAVFAGGWTLAAATAIVATEREVLDGLTALVGSSLVQRSEQSDGASRFSMLEPIRQFAREQLEEHAEEADTHARHAVFFCAQAAQAAPHLARRAAATWCDRLEREHDNLRAALRWCVDVGDVVAGLNLVGDLRDFWFTRGFFSEGIARATVILDLLGAADLTTERARALATRAWLAFWHGDYLRAIADCNEAMAICARRGERGLEPFVRNTLGIAYKVTSDVALARTLFVEALAGAREVGDTQTMARALNNLAVEAADEGDVARAIALFDDCIAISRASGDDGGMALALWSKSQVLSTTGGLHEAVRLARASLALYRDLGGQWGVRQCLEHLAALALADADPGRAVQLYASASVLGHKHGIAHEPADETTSQRQLSQARALLGDTQFETLWALQLSTPLNQVLDEALADSSAPPPRPSSPHGLSPRELEVLRLLVEGKSDREIAARLFISHHTVMRHVSNILSKLAVESRTVAATYAVRHRLV